MFPSNRTVKELYARIEELKEEAEIKVQVTYIEIYNEEIKDLINAEEGRPSRPLKVNAQWDNAACLALSDVQTISDKNTIFTY